MKNEYGFYGKSTARLEASLGAGDREILERYLTFCSTTAGPGKIKDYKMYMLQFRDVIEMPLDEITKDDAVAFWALVNHSPHEANTKIMIRRTAKRFLKWFYRDLDMVESLKNGSFVVNKKRINKSTLLKPHEIQLMLHRAEKLRDKVLLVLLYETAARPQEIRDLKWHDINWDENEVHLYSSKKQDDRDLPIQEAVKHLRRWKDEWVYPDPHDEDYVFPSAVGPRHVRGKPISVTYIGRIIASIAKKAGIQRPVFPYLLRHTRLTELHRLGVRGLEHNKFAGHRAGSKHQAVYVHLDNDDMKKSVLEKVYNIKENPEEQVDKYEQEIKDLKRQLGEVLDYLRGSKEAMQLAVAGAGERVEQPALQISPK